MMMGERESFLVILQMILQIGLYRLGKFHLKYNTQRHNVHSVCVGVYTSVSNNKQVAKL